MTHEKRRFWLQRMRLLLAVMIGIGGIWFVYVWQQIDQTVQEAMPRHADVGIVLGAAVWGEGPSPGLRERLDYALWLYQNDYVPYLLVSGGLGEGKQVTEASVMKAYLVRRGVAPEHILMEPRATNTYENLLYSQQVMQENNKRSALIISHDYHLARAMTIADSLGMIASPAGTASHVLYEPYYKTREVLALSYLHLLRFCQLALDTMVFA